MKSTLSAPATFALFSYLTKVALADFPLYIPGYDPQPLSVTVLGVGSDGHTTYQVSPAKATDPSQDDSSNPTITLVEGPTDAFYTALLPVETGSPDIVYESCSFGSNAGGQALCVLSGSGADLNFSGVQTETEDVTPITVQGNNNAAAPTNTVTGGSNPSASGGSSSSPTSGGGPSQPSNTSNGSSGTGSASNSAASPTNSGAASSIAHPVGGNAVVLGAGLFAALFALA